MRKTSALLAATTIAATVAMPVAASAATTPSAQTTKITQTTANAATTTTTGSTAIPTFDYSDCPKLPAGVDPAKWRCEVLVAQGTATIGGLTFPFDFTRVTHAEGPLPDGTPGQVFGGFRAARLPVSGPQSGNSNASQSDSNSDSSHGNSNASDSDSDSSHGYDNGRGHSHSPKLWVQPHLAAAPDFYSQSGAMSLTFQLTGPRLGEHCTIGTTAAPVQVAAGRVAGTTQWLSQDPPVITFEVQDQTFSAPQVSGCGRAGAELNRRFALPSPSGANRLSATAFYSFKTYDQL